MSHISTVDLVIEDLDALAEAAGKLGLVLHRGATSYKWFGRFVGDYNDPQVQELGIPVSEYGKCQHKLSVVGNEHAYEIGLAKNPKGRGYVLLFDHWGGGSGLMEKVSTVGSRGTDCNRLKQEYATEVARRQLRRQGYRVREIREKGNVRLEAVR